MMGVEKVTAFFPHKSPRAFVEIESPLARAFVAFYSMINSIVLFCVTMVICYNLAISLISCLHPWRVRANTEKQQRALYFPL